jgi:hypothetical protein
MTTPFSTFSSTGRRDLRDAPREIAAG